MGHLKKIDMEHFPTQGNFLGTAVRVCFGFDTSKTLVGHVVRADAEEPWVMIIRLPDGKHILSTECQFQPIEWPIKRAGSGD